MNRERALCAFKDYADRYDTKDIKVALKIAHTFRVASIAERIARSRELAMDEYGAGMLRATFFINGKGQP